MVDVTFNNRVSEVMGMSVGIKVSEKVLNLMKEACTALATLDSNDVNATVKSNLMQIQSYAIAIINLVNKLIVER